MPRKKRIWYPNAVYHVMSRGNRKTPIFQEKSDFCQFLEYVKNVKEDFPFELHSLCLMTNHFHFLIETKETELSKIMQRILQLYAKDYNMKYNLTGHVFENRYISSLIEDDSYFLEVSRYIHLNPVKAFLVEEPLDYEYSSYGVYVKNDKSSMETYDTIKELVETKRVLHFFRDNSSEKYREFVEEKISHAKNERIIQKDIKEDDMWLP